jgi:DNA-binding transcriptional LysR family regulator
VSQPSVTNVLKHAEQRLGFLLFDRIKGRLVPTAEAHYLFEDVRDIYERVYSLKQTARNLERGVEDYIRVAVLPTLGLEIAPKAVARFHERYPSVKFDLQTLHHEDIMRTLYERGSDLVFAFEAPRQPRLDHIDLGSGELVLFYRDHDIPDAPRRIDLADIVGHEFITMANSGPLGTLFTGELERRDIQLNDVASARTFYVAAALVQQGIGMAVIDNFTAEASLIPGLSYRPLHPPISFEVQCVFARDRRPSRVSETFISVFRELLQAV